MGIRMLATICLIVLNSACTAFGLVFYVDSSEDLPDTNPGDGIAMASNGKTTFRAAIDEANALPGADGIYFTDFSAETPGEPAIAINGTLIIKDDLSIGQKRGVSRVNWNLGGTPFRVFDIDTNIIFKIINSNIFISGQGEADRGGFMYIHENACVSLEGITAQDGGHATIAGGGIYVDHATLGLYDTETGDSDGDGGTVYNDHGLVYSYGAVGGSARRGGNIFNDGGYMYFDQGMVPGNASQAGGAIYTNGGYLAFTSVRFFPSTSVNGGSLYIAGGATVTLSGCTFFQDTVSGDGASVYLESGTLKAAQCSFGQGNAGGSGGAVYLAGGDATFINCTFAGNNAGAAGGAIAVAPGAICRMGNTVTATNTTPADQLSQDISGTIVSLGHNAIGIGDGVTGLLSNDLTGSLNNPFDTQIDYTYFRNKSWIFYAPPNLYVPRSSSPLIDAGDTALLASPDYVGDKCYDITLDPAARIRGASVDIGSVELQEGAADPDLCTAPAYSADYDGDGRISLGELLRVIQLYNGGSYHCITDITGFSYTEDGYDMGPGPHQYCMPHSADYDPQDWAISITELLRVIQIYNAGAYHPCPEGEDGFCPGAA